MSVPALKKYLAALRFPDDNLVTLDQYPVDVNTIQRGFVENNVMSLSTVWLSPSRREEPRAERFD
jgi:hypothetical protein